MYIGILLGAAAYFWFAKRIRGRLAILLSLCVMHCAPTLAQSYTAGVPALPATLQIVAPGLSSGGPFANQIGSLPYDMYSTGSYQDVIPPDSWGQWHNVVNFDGSVSYATTYSVNVLFYPQPDGSYTAVVPLWKGYLGSVGTSFTVTGGGAPQIAQTYFTAGVGAGAMILTYKPWNPNELDVIAPYGNFSSFIVVNNSNYLPTSINMPWTAAFCSTSPNAYAPSNWGQNGKDDPPSGALSPGSTSTPASVGYSTAGYNYGGVFPLNAWPTQGTAPVAATTQPAMGVPVANPTNVNDFPTTAPYTAAYLDPNDPGTGPHWGAASTFLTTTGITLPSSPSPTIYSDSSYLISWLAPSAWSSLPGGNILNTLHVGDVPTALLSVSTAPLSYSWGPTIKSWLDIFWCCIVGWYCLRMLWAFLTGNTVSADVSGDPDDGEAHSWIGADGTRRASSHAIGNIDEDSEGEHEEAVLM